MRRILFAHIIITATILLSACVTLAPGADQVRVTDKASDVPIVVLERAAGVIEYTGSSLCWVPGSRRSPRAAQGL